MLPTFLRKQNLTDLLEITLRPIKLLYEWFVGNRNNNLYQLDITSQVCKLEKVLNDRFDSVSRRIKIIDGNYVGDDFIFTAVESNFIYLHDDAPFTLKLSGEYNSQVFDFIIQVPGAVAFDESEMTVLINSYKLASKTFTIQIV